MNDFNGYIWFSGDGSSRVQWEFLLLGQSVKILYSIVKKSLIKFKCDRKHFKHTLILQLEMYHVQFKTSIYSLRVEWTLKSVCFSLDSKNYLLQSEMTIMLNGGIEFSW